MASTAGSVAAAGPVCRSTAALAGAGATVTALPTTPNIVYVVTDDQTYESLYTAMPYLSSRPRGSWTTFTNAVVSVANCCPSRSSVLTGQYAHHHGVITNGLGQTLDDANLLPVWLRDVGYRTALFGKYLNNYPWDKGDAYIPPGWDRWFAYNPVASATLTDSIVINDQGVNTPFPSTPRQHSADLFARKAASFVKTAPEPFFAYVSMLTPHYPFNTARRNNGVYAGAPVTHTAAFDEADVSDKPAWVQALPRLTARQEARMDTDRRKMWESVLGVDQAINTLVDTLATRGVLEDTIVMVTSDNGLSFGEHRWKELKNCAYEECIRVPLMVRVPGQPNRTEQRVVSNVDIGTTISALAGATPGRPQDGRSFSAMLDGSMTSWTSEVLLYKPVGGGGGGGGDGTGNPASSQGFPVTPYWGLRTDRYTYVEYNSGERELYDLAADPAQTQNIHGQPGTEAISAQLAARVAALKQ